MGARSDVSKAMADKVGGLLAGGRVALLHGPPELLLPEVARLVMATFGPEHTEVTLDADVAPAVAAMSQPVPLLLLARDGVLTDELDDALQTAVCDLVLVVDESDESGLVDSMGFDVALGPRELLLDGDQLAALDDRLASPHVLPDTSGVPALVAGLLDGTAAEVAAGWADRVADRVLDDDLLRLLARTGPLADSTTAYLATTVLGRPVSPADVDRARTPALFTLTWRGRRGMPRLVATAIRRLSQQRDADGYRSRAGDLADLVESDDRLGALNKLSILVTLRAWAHADRLLARRLHTLVSLSQEDRLDLAARLPARVPPTHPHLAAARAFVTQGPRATSVNPGTPQMWVDLGFLLAHQERGLDTPTVAAVREWFRPLARHGQPLPLADARGVLAASAETLTGLAHALMDTDPRLAPDDAALIIGLFSGAFDTACATGNMEIAHRANRLSSRLGLDMGTTVQHYSTLWSGVLARSALLAGRGGLPDLARQRLADVEQFSDHGPDPRIDLLTETAREFAALTVGALGPRDMAVVDVQHRVAPLRAEAETLHIALLNGSEAALTWARQTASRANWSSAPRWTWWPLFQTLALLEIQAGRTALANGWISMTDFAPVQSFTIRAALAHAEGRVEEALALAGRAVELAEADNRARVLALGVRLACLADDPAREGEVQAILASEPWGDVLGALVLFPHRARDLVVSHVGEPIAALPGLQPTAATGHDAAPDVRLTPRQVDVLRGLAEGQTMQEIAADLFVSVETVRSTAKELYRRLQVHGREGAVQAARSLGLLTDRP